MRRKAPSPLDGKMTSLRSPLSSRCGLAGKRGRLFSSAVQMWRKPIPPAADHDSSGGVFRQTRAQWLDRSKHLGFSLGSAQSPIRLAVFVPAPGFLQRENRSERNSPQRSMGSFEPSPHGQIFYAASGSVSEALARTALVAPRFGRPGIVLNPGILLR